LIERDEFLTFLKSRIDDPMEQPEVKKAIYTAGLLLEPKKAKTFAESVGMVYIPSGKSVIGVDKPEVKLWDSSFKSKILAFFRLRKPKLLLLDLRRQEVDFPAFFIDKYTVTNSQFSQFIKAGGYKNSKYWTEEGWKFITQQGYTEPRYWQDEKWNQPDHPVVGVSWYEARAYAHWTGKELPLEVMWEKAARGTDERKYPWGNEPPDEMRCNFGGQIGQTTPVSQYEAGKSPYEVYDMAGNVWEWCEDWYDSEKVLKVLRGGSWWNNAEDMRASVRDRIFPSYRGRKGNEGFRCARTVSLCSLPFYTLQAFVTT
jgi:serine/threonine-protein kinase